jgi:hypothetical protein
VQARHSVADGAERDKAVHRAQVRHPGSAAVVELVAAKGQAIERWHSNQQGPSLPKLTLLAPLVVRATCLQVV